MNSKGLLFLFALIVVTVFLFGSVAHSEDVAALNAMIHARGARWVAGETSMSRLSPAERASRLGLLRHSSAPAGQVLAAPALGVNLPTSLDWRNYNGASYVTSIKDQGGCGACWAFATTGATESNTLVVNGTPNTDLDLSEQVLISCGGAGGCAGGYIDEASNYIRHTGLPLESCYPYSGNDGSCSYACAGYKTSTYKIQGWSWVIAYGTTPTTTALKNAVYTNGPLPTAMAVYSDFYNYVGGVYTYTSGSLVGYHAIIIVGYDDLGQYFIVKNSWGTGWGEQGYFRIAYSELTGMSEFGFETIAYPAPQNNYTLAVSKTGTGTGAVNSWPAGINCGTTCSANYASGTQVTLTATPDTNMTFAGWSGACSGAGTCTVTMDGAKSVTAIFNLGGTPSRCQRPGREQAR